MQIRRYFILVAFTFWLASSLLCLCCCQSGLCSQFEQTSGEHPGHKPEPGSDSSAERVPLCDQWSCSHQMLALVGDEICLKKDLPYNSLQTDASFFNHQTQIDAIYHPPEA